MKRAVFPLISLLLLLFLSACGNKTASFDVNYQIVGTKHNQYFCLSADTLLADLNTNLDIYDLSLVTTPKEDNDLSVWYSDDGTGWKVIARLMGAFNAGLSAETKSWSGYIGKVELDLYADSPDDAKRNGQYIRAIIATFTPGAEEIVEDALGIYGPPSRKTIIGDGVSRVIMENVVYTYLDDNHRFEVTPYDVALFEQANKEEQNIVRPE